MLFVMLSFFFFFQIEETARAATTFKKSGGTVLRHSQCQKQKSRQKEDGSAVPKCQKEEIQAETLIFFFLVSLNAVVLQTALFLFLR